MKDIRILLIDESSHDEITLSKKLESSGYKPEITRLINLEQIKTIAIKKSWDIILTEHTLSEFTSLELIAMAQESKIDIPIVILSSMISEDFAVEAMKAGAKDYIRKDNMTRLIPVIERELRETDSRNARKMAEEAVYYMAFHDPLTGLANRYEFESKLIKILDDVKENPELHYCLLYIDLDQFKVVNDTCGHPAGDDLLRQVSVILGQSLKKDGFAARIGGDEFTIILENHTIEKASEFAENLLRNLAEFRFNWMDKIFVIGGSIGIIRISSKIETINEILSRADMACYAAKEAGRNRAHIYIEDDRQMTFRMQEMQWLSRLNESLEQDLFTLYKQPIVSIPYNKDTSVLFYEFLLRLRTDNGSLIMPDVFMRAAERYNLMPSLDRWVVENAFRYIAKHFANKEERKQETRFFINLSGASMSDNNFFNFTFKKMQEYGIEPGLICFEITETVAISDFKKAIDFIKEVRSRGSYFALDDFGSGMSSFSYLKNFTVDYVKIDGSFVRDMKDDPLDYAIVESINKISHIVGLKTIAEFVEDMGTMDILEKLGIDYAQGFGIARPHST
ncbi:MAG TPA: EAL domain-containing protein [Leptospiraceae bacterium]|nr:EAL domain-containing protein [Leptospiraceae bacterium]HRG74162.1 EAL domain-containing protein [Leptospiraceae bacterium]